MKPLLVAAAIACALAPLGLGCASTNRQPMFKSAGIAPDQLQPGNRAIITAVIDDPFGVVARVEGQIKEDPSMEFSLKDDGVAPDDRAGDSVWTMEVKVPFNAPIGDFHFTVSAYNSSGQLVLVRNELGEVMPLDTRFSLSIAVPPAQ